VFQFQGVDFDKTRAVESAPGLICRSFAISVAMSWRSGLGIETRASWYLPANDSGMAHDSDLPQRLSVGDTRQFASGLPCQRRRLHSDKNIEADVLASTRSTRHRRTAFLQPTCQ
jgi:hypothetical protein